MVKICFDAGHSRDTPGKRSPNDEREWVFNDKVVDAAMLFLSKYENVQMLRVDDGSGKVDIPLIVRTNKANNWNADVYVSCHHNALIGKWGDHGGVETFTYDGQHANQKSVEIANIIHPHVIKAMGIGNRGVKKANFHVLRETKMPSVLIEGGFMDSRIDIKAMRDDKRLKAQGEAIAKGLVEYFNLKLKDDVKPVVNEIVKPVSKPIEEVIELAEKAIIINSFIDYPAVQKLHIRKGYPIFERAALKEKVAKELIIAGGGVKGLEKFGDRLTDLSGKDREETGANVKKYMNK